MKVVLFVFLLVANSCTLRSQEKYGVVVINHELKNIFYDNPPIVAQEGSLKFYSEGVLVDSSESSNWDIIINSNIKDIIDSHYSLDTCRGFFNKDTLMIYFRNISKATDRGLLIKIINGNYYPYYINYFENKNYSATPISLTLRNDIPSKKKKFRKQKIFGELEISYFDKEYNREHRFKGPFFCVTK